MNRKKLQIVAGMIIVCLMIMNPNIVSARTYSRTTTQAQRNNIANDWTYYKRGYNDYNCLAYAMGNNTQWYWPWGTSNPTIQQAKNWLKNKCKYKIADKDKKSGLSKYVICVYANTQGKVTHFARTTKINGNTLGKNIACVAKWGQCELFTHKSRNPYKKNGLYGAISFIAHRDTQNCASKCPTA